MTDSHPNLPRVTAGLVAVSRDCFPVELSRRRRQAVAEACRTAGTGIVELDGIVENEADALAVLAEAAEKEVNALVVYLGNFGPEGPATLLAERFDGPVMFAAAAEETGDDLIGGRGDAYCGLLSASYNLDLRSRRVHLPPFPVGDAGEVADMIADFLPVARVVLGVQGLKIFGFGPRPHDFFACNAPIKPLFDLGVEVMENSELDLYDLYRAAEGRPGIDEVAAEMAGELGAGNTWPDLLPRLAQFEVALMDFWQENRGAARFGVFANKCWPSFEKYFGFVPCYVNSRLAARGIPVACEVDLYGALSEYLGSCATGLPVTILDINNTVPADLLEAGSELPEGCEPRDLFMGFHCGNTPAGCLAGGELKYQLIMHRLMEPDAEPDITRGTLEGPIRPGEITIHRLQASAGGELRAYVAEGEVLDLPPRSFGGIGVIGVPGMARFYRHVLLARRFPHHTAVAFAHTGKTLYAALQMLGVEDISWNQPAYLPYPGENPFA